MKADIKKAMLANIPTLEELQRLGYKDAQHYQEVQTIFIELMESCLSPEQRITYGVIAHLIEMLTMTLRIDAEAAPGTDAEYLATRRLIFVELLKVIASALSLEVAWVGASMPDKKESDGTVH